MFAKAAAMPPLHRDGMAARREYLGDARRLQPTGGHPHASAQTCTAGTYDNAVVRMIDDAVGLLHGLCAGLR